MKSSSARLASIQIEPPVPPLSLIASMELRTRFNTTCSICKTSTITGGSPAARCACAATLARSRSGLHNSMIPLDDTLEGDGCTIAAIEPYQCPQTSDHLSGAIDLRGCFLRCFRDLPGIDIVRVYRVGHETDVGTGGHQRLIDFVSDRSR